MEWMEIELLVIIAFLGAGYVLGGIIHMMIKRELKDIRQELMKKDADIRKLERRIY